MCRFLIIKSRKQARPEKLLKDFASICRRSKTLDGDWQGDGWGVAWLNHQNKWQLKRSLSPIWEDQAKFKKIPKTKLLVIHARSASFPNQKGKIEYNQPYINGKYCFVFNGMLRGVKLKKTIKGEIGAQKVWSLLQQQLEVRKPAQSLKNVYKLLKNNARNIEGCNIGLISGDNLFALCGQYYNQEYFTLKVLESGNQQIICSEEIGPYKFRGMKEEEVVKL